MSRCFPYPPPGYEVTNRGGGGALLSQSIESEREKVKKERKKEKKIEHKEKKKHKKDKSRDRDCEKKREHEEEKKHKKDKSRDRDCEKKREHEEEKKHKKEKPRDGDCEKKTCSQAEKRSKEAHKRVDHSNGGEYEPEHRERSSLTEEHGPPANAPKLCDSSDSTQNSSKWGKHSPSPEGGHNQCTMLRIRLPLLKHKETELLSNKEQPWPISGRTDIITQKMIDAAPRPGKTQANIISGRSEVINQKMVGNAVRSDKGQIRLISGSTASVTRKMLDNAHRPYNKQARHLISGMVDNAPRSNKEQSQPKSKRTETITQNKIDIRSSKGQLHPVPETTETITQNMSNSIGKPGKEHHSGPIQGIEIMHRKNVDMALTRSCKEQPSTSGKKETKASDGAKLSRSKRRLLDLDSQFRDMIENWALPPVEFIHSESEDLQWLFDASCKQEAKRQKSNDGVTCVSSNLWPRASYSPEVDMHALPYTVPY